MISPKEVTPAVENLLQLMKAEFEPEQVQVRVEHYATPLNCYINVAEKIKRDGGKIHYGWVVWVGKYICEAEHHAVWEDEDESLLCITPRSVETDTIMFIPDNEKVYAGQSYDNIRTNMTNNPLVDDFITLCEINEKLYALGERLDDTYINLPQSASNEIARNDMFKHQIELFIDNGGRLGSSCFCGSGKPYSNCHGKNLINIARQNLNTIKQELLNSNNT